jgi:hypothetical protein
MKCTLPGSFSSKKKKKSSETKEKLSGMSVSKEMRLLARRS